nr:immunoglobulin light chain junction region [Macaca mulatta]
CQQHNSKPYSF